MSKLTPKTKQGLRARRHRRARAKVAGTASRPRLAVFRSNRGIYAQLIDDVSGTTLASVAPAKGGAKGLMEQAKAAGTALAAAAKTKGITTAVFDRGGFTYTGRVKALADAARAGGLTF
ncbi:MAG: 50S ribosomal protein L18 [Candidatus Paceibacteria bacterium]